MKKLRAVISIMIVLTFVLCGCSSSSKSGTLKVGVRDDIMNFSYLNPTTEQYYGLEIDLANKLAEDLGYEKVELITVNPENRKEMLLEGKVDCLIAAYSIVETRKENFDFSPAYYSDYSRVMVEKSSMLNSMDQLLGLRIGTVEGANTAPVFATKLGEMGLVPDFDLKTFNAVTFVKMDSYADLDVALEEGTVDAACMDGCIARTYMNDNRLLLDETLHQEDYGVATQKGSKLSEPVAKSVQKMLDDGTIDKLIDKWD